MTTIFLVIDDNSGTLGVSSTREKAEELAKIYSTCSSGPDYPRISAETLDDVVDHVKKGLHVYKVRYGDKSYNKDPLSVERMTDTTSIDASSFIGPALGVTLWASGLHDAVAKADHIRCQWIADQE